MFIIYTFSSFQRFFAQKTLAQSKKEIIREKLTIKKCWAHMQGDQEWFPA